MKLLKTLSLTLFLLLFAACTTPPQETDDPEIPAGDTTIVVTSAPPVNTIKHVAFTETLAGSQQATVWIDNAAEFSGLGVLHHSPDTTIVWDIDYDKTGFLPAELHGEFRMYKCN